MCFSRTHLATPLELLLQSNQHVSGSLKSPPGPRRRRICRLTEFWRRRALVCAVIHLAFISLLLHCLSVTITAQDTVTGAFEGIVTDSQSGARLRGAAIQIINQQTGVTYNLRTDYRGRFFQGLLLPGTYTIRVSLTGYQTKEAAQILRITSTGEVVPVPVALDTLPATTAPPPPPNPLSVEDTDIRSSIPTTDGRRSGSFTESEVATIPIGMTTVTRTFDELALLLPGIAATPQTVGSVAGPGVGGGVGSAGQFSSNGLRSRANNFTVDGSDNNDEDIGVRRQGFVALIPQPIDSIQEYHVITLLAPAQFGRNIGAQVNAVSKSGGSETHGTVYATFNSSQLNARKYFDSLPESGISPLLTATGQAVLLEGQPITTRNESGGEDSLTFAQFGGVLGGPIKRGTLFYFLSGEGQRTNATQEESFAVPTVEERGAFGSGATGLFLNPLTGTPTATIPTGRNGGAVFSLYPFANNPNGVYGMNTFTDVLPAGSHGVVLSGRTDLNFKLAGREQSITERYNFTDDSRVIPVTGGAIFSSLQPRLRTQNSSFFLNSLISHPNSDDRIFNQLRLSYGRTRLNFDEVRHPLLTPSVSLPNIPFLLNREQILNTTTPAAPGLPNQGPVVFSRALVRTVEEEIGPLGQVVVEGYSPLGVDVYNFPQRRVNNTYQIADQMTLRFGSRTLTVGTDNRRTELNSELPRNSRPLVTFNGAPRLIFENGTPRLPTSTDPNPIIRPTDLVAIGSPNNLFLTLSTGGPDSINLRFYQLSFYGQHDWRVSDNLSLAVGLRYEYNTPPRELHSRIENSFSDPLLNMVPGLNSFIQGRTSINDSDRNNFAPRIGVAYSGNLFGAKRLSVLRGGYGIFYDQILGAVVSQSRNVFPSFLTLNFGGGPFTSIVNEFPLVLYNPATNSVFVGNDSVPLELPGTLNRLNPALPLSFYLPILQTNFPSAISPTLPSRRLDMPKAHHYSVNFEQQLYSNVVVNAAYVSTRASQLLRFSTPNLGPALNIVPTGLRVIVEQFLVPEFLGHVVSPPRPTAGVGAINIYETTASSSYHSLQLQVRGRFRRTLQFQTAYTLSKSTDDVSDVFDLAGASALPQNSLTFENERGPSNFDSRHRLSSEFIFDLPQRVLPTRFLRQSLNVQIAGTAYFHTGQPFTVNSTIDINQDGNLTDRLNTLEGLRATGDRRQPLALTTTNTLSLLAPFGQDGRIGRNTFRAGSIFEWNSALITTWKRRSGSLILRTDVFNVPNRANFAIPTRFLEAPAFGQSTRTVTPGRRVQFSLKYTF